MRDELYFPWDDIHSRECRNHFTRPIMSLMVLNINYVQSSILEIASDLGFFFNQWQLNKDIKGNFISAIVQVETGLRTNPI